MGAGSFPRSLLFCRVMSGAVLHKGAAFVFCVTLMAFADTAACGQQPAVHRIQGVVGSLRTSRQAHEIDLLLRAQAGVRMSRTDYNSRNIVLEVTPDCTLSESQLSAILAQHNLTLSCFQRRIGDQAPFALLDPRACTDHPTAR